MWPSVTLWSPGKALGEEWVGLGSQKGLWDGHHEGMKASLGRVQNLPKGWGWEQIRVQGKSTSPFSAKIKKKEAPSRKKVCCRAPTEQHTPFHFGNCGSSSKLLYSLPSTERTSPPSKRTMQSSLSALPPEGKAFWISGPGSLRETMSVSWLQCQVRVPQIKVSQLGQHLRKTVKKEKFQAWENAGNRLWMQQKRIQDTFQQKAKLLSLNRSFRYGDISESHGVMQIAKKKTGGKKSHK